MMVVNNVNRIDSRFLKGINGLDGNEVASRQL
jgi:hypothetical protein